MGERFGDYELLRKIATGGMAEIYLARLSTAEGFGRPVVVKRMLPQLAVRSDFVTMFLDEARLAANLGHPNVVQVFNLGSHDGAYFMAMELIDGPHLGALFAHSLRQRRPLPIEFCAYVVARSSDGLDYAHDLIDPATGQALSIVHRDISPQNILVSRHGDVKVTDFGVAKATTQEAKTRTGIIKGKVSYMSPEQCLGEKVDRRTDVFALGIVLYELLTRRRLFRDKSDLLVMQRITSEDVKPPSTLNSAIDAELDAICLKALAKQREDRYSTAADLSEALDFWLATNGHGDARGGLARWMTEHAPELGLKLDAETSDPGSSPRWLDGPITGGKQEAPLPAVTDDEEESGEEGGNTVSTPALSSAMVQGHDAELAGLPDRARVAGPDATMVGAELGPTDSVDLPTELDPSRLDSSRSDPSRSDPGRSGSSPSAPSSAGQGPSDEGDTLIGLETLRPTDHSGTLLNAPAPGDEARRRPLAAMLGGAAALALAVVAGVFVLGGEQEETRPDGDGRHPSADPSEDPADDPGDDPGDDSAPDPAPQPGDGDDDPAPTPRPGIQSTNPNPNPTENPTAPPTEGDPELAPGADSVTLTVETDPPGVPIEVGTKLARSPFSGPVAPGTELEVRALFGSGAVTAKAKVAKKDLTVRLTEKQPVIIEVYPPSARWTLEGPGLKKNGSGDVKEGPSLVPGKTYVLRGDAGGYEAKRIELVPRPGEPVKASLRLSKRSPPSRPTRTGGKEAGEGTLRLFAEPFVKVDIAGDTFNAPVRDEKVRAGPHRVTVHNASLGIRQTLKVVIGKDKLTVVKLRWAQEGDTWKIVKSEVSKPQ